MLGKLKNKIKVDSLRYCYYNHVDQIPKEDWLKIQKNNTLFLSIPYLQTLENTLSENISFTYVIFYDASIPIGIAATQLLKVDTSDINLSDFPCKINDTIKNVLLHTIDVRVLICGNLFSCGEHGFIFDSNIKKSMAIDMLSKALLELRKKDATDKPSFILVKEFWPKSSAQLIPLENHKFREFCIDYNMVLTILPAWQHFEDYLASMKTKFRTRAKKVFKNSRNIVIQNLDVPDIVRYTKDINQLYHSVLDNADFKIGKLNAATFLSLKENLGELFMFKGYFLEDQLVGFTTAFITNNAIEANHIGINYELNKTHDIYQRMLYDYVNTAIHSKVAELHLGRTAETIKSGVGAKPIAMKLYVRHGNSISNKLLKPLIEMISPSEFETRNPFKQLSE